MLACPNTSFPHALLRHQRGMTLIEVLVAVLILTIGLLGAAVIQLNALKYTDSARMTSQASFIAYDMLDRIRANSAADYAWERSERAPASSATASVRDQDLHDFEANILGFAGESAKGAVSISANEATVSISWDDSRGANSPGARETFILTSRVSDEPGVTQ
ncbi:MULTISPECIES: type IV pilus modification protein PilV [Pseudomonas]|uniref:Type IV pilus modification protein PilV n=1 Tax=Pseudomonas tritici TaxID=2745518 RepID=A0A8H9Z4K3_9PSED|nr:MULTISPECIES: type IV pilus modification protein PilV [Pseudomonas]MBP2874602.1 type IV pilus modification protein PilV [Pseudomonas sp. SWRI144]MBW8125528.1 type IV pilus modification protein PilV [Pseudomonas sp. LAP_36]MBW8136857.1 type IV pilus modification protein PilV [Pseudomonas sp. PAMC 26818]QXH84851.1 type IV pilus modification protein PilV [Pseudomonas tritici]CRL96799.1 type IV pilus modification protein PilV [Pseudomonas sp. 24 E 1]